jgi:hypothetical protein
MIGFQSVDGQWGRNLPVGTLAASTLMKKAPITIRNLLCFNSGKCLNLGDLGPMRLTIRFVPPAALWTNNATSPNISLTNMSFQYDVLSLPQVYTDMSNSLLSNGGSYNWSFDTYTSYLSSLVAVDYSTSRVPCSSQSLDGIIHTTLKSTYADLVTTAAGTGEVLFGGTLLGSNTPTLISGYPQWFTHGEAAGKITGFSFQVGSTVVPTFRMLNPVEGLAMVSDFFGKTQNMAESAGAYFSNAPVPAGEITDNEIQLPYTTAFFVAACKLNHGSDYEYGSKLISGVDCRGSSVLIGATVYASGGASIIPLTFLKCTASLIVSANRQLAFIP